MENKDPMRVTYRDIGKMLASALPIEGHEFGTQVEHNISTIRALPESARLALKSAYIFSRKVPREEREDLFQELALAVLKSNPTDERLAYSIARCDWVDWWRKYKQRQHYSLDTVVSDSEGNSIPYGELLVGDCEFDNRMNGKLDGEALYKQLPNWVKTIVDKRLLGKSITGGERHMLDKFVASRPTILASYQS